MEQAFDRIYHTRLRDFVQQKLVSFGMVILFTILVGVAVATSAILPALKHIPHMPEFLYSDGARDIPQMIVGVFPGVVFVGSIYYVIPNRTQGLFQILPRLA